MGVSHSCCRRSNIRSASIRCAFPKEKKRKRKSTQTQAEADAQHTFYLDLSPLRHPPAKGLQVFIFPLLSGLAATLIKLDAVKCFPSSLLFGFCLTVLMHLRLLLVKQTPFFSSSGTRSVVICFHDSLKRPLPSYSR